MGVKIWINRGHIYLSLCYNKKQWRESTGLTVSADKNQNKEIMRMAEIMRSKREIAIACGKSNITDLEKTRLSLYEYADGVLKEYHNRKALPYIALYGGKDIKISAVNAEWYESFQEQIQNDPVLRSAYTQKKYCDIVRNVLKKALRENLLADYPAEHIRNIKTPDSLRAFLTPAEIHSLQNTPCPGRYAQEVKPAFLLGAYTGLRVSDLKSLLWEEIDISEKLLSKKMQKTKECIYIPLTEPALALLQGIEHTSVFVFPQLAELTDISTTNRNITAWARAAGIQKHVTWHVARHTNATQLLEAGADLYTVQKLLGHTAIATTAKYTKVTDRKKREAVNQLTERLNENEQE